MAFDPPPQKKLLYSPFYNQCSFIMLSLCQYALCQPLHWAMCHVMTTQPRHCAHCRWQLIGPAGRALCLLCAGLILLRILWGKVFISKLPIASGLTEMLMLSHLPLSLSLSISLAITFTYFFLSLLSNSLSLFLSLAVSNNVFHPAVKLILQKCLKFNINIPVSRTKNKSDFWMWNYDNAPENEEWLIRS